MKEEVQTSTIKKEYKNFALTSDILIFSVSNEKQDYYKKAPKKQFSILLVKRGKYPYPDRWTLPGGYVGENEILEDATDRILFKETNLKQIYKEQLYTFDSLDRDPRMRTISTAYMALINKDNLDHKLNENASWFHISLQEDGDIIIITLEGEETISFKVKRVLKEKTTDRYEYEILENENIGFDHAIIILAGIYRLRNKIKDTDIIFNMMPDYFTLGELQRVYEIILNKKLLDPAFRRIIANRVVKTEKYLNTGGHRPSILYQYKEK